MVRLVEYQGKQLLEKGEIPVPNGEIASSSDEAEKVAKKIGEPVAIKSQIMATGRMKAGGIKFADTPKEAGRCADELLGSVVKGHEVEKVLVEERLDIDKEFFGSLIVDDSYKTKGPRFILSSEGGVEIEEVAKKSPEKIARTSIDISTGLRPYHVHNLALRLDFERDLIRPLGEIFSSLYKVFVSYDARSAEINPLVLMSNNVLYAADCRIAIDDASAYRHPEFEFEVPRDMTRKPTSLEKAAWKIEEVDYRGVAYFTQINPEPPKDKKNGYIGFHAIGGGGAMKAADVLTKHDFVLANYTDTSGNPTASKVYRATKVGLAQPEIEGYMVLAPTIANQNQWHHGHGFVKAFREGLREKEGFPVIILICGNKEKETHEILKRGLEDLPIHLEIYGRELFHELDMLSERLKEAVLKYRQLRSNG